METNSELIVLTNSPKYSQTLALARNDDSKQNNFRGQSKESKTSEVWPCAQMTFRSSRTASFLAPSAKWHDRIVSQS